MTITFTVILKDKPEEVFEEKAANDKETFGDFLKRIHNSRPELKSYNSVENRQFFAFWDEDRIADLGLA